METAEVKIKKRVPVKKITAKEAEEIYKDGGKIMTPHDEVYFLDQDTNANMMYFARCLANIKISQEQPPFGLYADGWTIIEEIKKNISAS
ncbi:MAG: hypothetical protein WCF93_03800 [Candidatus Moraniibacteriota bacterium]